MSLLLLFPSRGGITWTLNPLGTATWINDDLLYRNQWGEWSALTWGAVASSGDTWSYLAGFTFINDATQTSTWTLQAPAT